MLRFLKKVTCIVGFLIAGLQCSYGFALLGPIINGDSWQVEEIGYNFPGDFESGPKNLGEEYRRNTPVIFYSATLNFREYFGSHGVDAIDNAFELLNNVTNVSSYSEDLSEWPLESVRQNTKAADLGLFDVKTRVLVAMMEQIGLAAPERWVWALHQRDILPDGECPTDMAYLVIRRNWDLVPSLPTQYQASSFVNGILYSFYVYEDCGDPDSLPDADAIEFPVDPLAPERTAVANPLTATVGDFHTTLTRDDVGGLRYLIRSNNINIESLGAGTQIFVTNSLSPTLLLTQDLGALLRAARTNDAAALAALFPGLITTSTPIGFEVIPIEFYTFVLTNQPFDPIGVIRVVTITNTVFVPVTVYQHTFQNIITNTFSSRSIVEQITSFTTNAPFAPIGTIVTNTVVRRFLTDEPSGSFIIIPDGLCGVTILSNVLTTVVPDITIETNIIGGVFGGFFAQATVRFFTNQALAFLPIECVDAEDLAAPFQGVERLKFIHIDDELLDPLTQTYLSPITNEYTMTRFNPTNKTLVPVRVRRIITQPDIVFTAQDGTPGPTSETVPFWEAPMLFRSLSFNSDFVLPAAIPLAGPGTIPDAGDNTVITFNKGGPFYGGLSPLIHSPETAEANLVTIAAWGSFDGTTNDPIVYPNGTSIQEMEYLRLLQFNPLPPNLPAAEVGVPYNTPLTVVNAQQPVTWTLAAVSPGGLPPGLTLSGAGVLSGTPTQGGTYDFALRLTDAVGRGVTVFYSMVINP